MWQTNRNNHDLPVMLTKVLDNWTWKPRHVIIVPTNNTLVSEKVFTIHNKLTLLLHIPQSILILNIQKRLVPQEYCSSCQRIISHDDRTLQIFIEWTDLLSSNWVKVSKSLKQKLRIYNGQYDPWKQQPM